MNQLRPLLGAGDVVTGADEETIWRAVREFSWAPGDWALVKTPLTLAAIPGLEAKLTKTTAKRRYAVGGNLVRKPLAVGA